MRLLVLSVYSPLRPKVPLSWVSWLIRKCLRFHWHHSAFLRIDDDGRMTIMESDIDGVVETPFEEWAMEKEVTVHALGPKSPTEAEVLEKIITRVGNTPYDFRGLLIHHVINQAFGIWIGPTKPGKAYERFTCGEYICWGAGWPLAYKATPKDVYLNFPVIFHLDKAKELRASMFQVA